MRITLNRQALKQSLETLDSLIRDSDMKKVETITVLKAAEASKEFQQHAKNNPGQHHVIGVRLGDEEFRLRDEEQRRQLQHSFFSEESQNSAQPVGKTFSSGSQKYEGNINTAVFDCTCGKTHAGFTPQHVETNPFERVTTEYGSNISEKKDDQRDERAYNPLRSGSSTLSSSYLQGDQDTATASFGSSGYLHGISDTSGTYDVRGKQKKSEYA